MEPGFLLPSTPAGDSRAAGLNILPAEDGEHPAGMPPPFLVKDITTQPKPPAPNSARKSESGLAENIKHIAEKYGIEHILVLTLTFRGNVKWSTAAEKRYNSLNVHVLKPRYGGALVKVKERQARGAWHFHILLKVPWDARTGCDFDAFERKQYSTASKELRAEWAYWRETAPKYGFGRTEMLPIKSSQMAIGRYFGKYLSKHFENRKQEDKGLRLVAYGSRKDRKVINSKWGWAFGKGQIWRWKCYRWALRHGCLTMEDVAAKYGSQWQYRFRFEIENTPLATDTVFANESDAAANSFKSAWISSYSLRSPGDLREAKRAHRAEFIRPGHDTDYVLRGT